VDATFISEIAAAGTKATSALCGIALLTALANHASAQTARVKPDTLASQILARAERGVSRQFVRPEEFRRPEDPDDTRSLQAALDTGQSVQLQDNHVYEISHVLLMRTGQRLAGVGPGTELRAAATWAPPAPTGNDYTLISNVSYAAGSSTDHSLIVENLTIDATSIRRSNGGFHGIGFRQASDIVVRNVICRNIGDCTAFESTTNSLVSDSAATGVTNVGFDHWEGPHNAVVMRSTVHVAKGGDGVMFTGGAGAWTSRRDRSGGHLVASDIHVYGPASAGVTANILTPGSSLTDVSFLNCFVDAQNSRDTSGIIITGNVTNSRIDHVIVQNLNGGQAIAVTPDKWHDPGEVTISNAWITNARVSARNVAPVVALGRGHRLTNVNIESGAYNFAFWFDDPSTSVDGHYKPGADGGVLYRSPVRR
jgi:hypothetical protein